MINQSQNLWSAKDTDSSNYHGKNKHGKYELFGSFTSFMRFFTTNVLGGNDGAASSKSGKDVDQQNVDCIDQRYTGNSSLTAAGNHDSISHTDGDGKKLFDDQRDNQALKVFFGKQEYPSFQNQFLCQHILKKLDTKHKNISLF